MRIACWLLLGVVASCLLGCDDAPRPRKPPTGETVDDLRNRRRQDGLTPANPADRPFNSAFDRSDFGQPGRQETLRPDTSGQAARAAEDAEDLRDAAADRPSRPRRD